MTDREPDRDLQDLRDTHRRLGLVIAALEEGNVSKVARDHDTSPQTVRRWMKRFQAEGAGGLLTRPPPGRPREVDEVIRGELVRLARDTRPPVDVGEQWTVRSLGAVFALSSSYVGKVWQEEGFRPPLHLQQVEAHPTRRTTLEVGPLTVPAWFALHLELRAREGDTTLEGLVLDALVGPDGLDALREEVEPGLRKRWWDRLRERPVVDPRRAEYRVELKRKRRAQT